MRRPLSITAFALFLLTLPGWAQRGGGHAGGFGGARAFSGGRAGGARFSGGMHSGFARGGPSSRGVHTSGFVNGTGNGSHSRFGNQFSNCFGAFCGHPGFGNRFGNPLRNCVGALCGSRFGAPWRHSGSGWGWGGWGWGWGSGYDPWLWSSWDYDDYRFDRDYYHDLAVAEEWNEENLAENAYRQQQADREQNAYSRRSNWRQNAEAQPIDQQPANQPATVLVFRDQHQKEVNNYAIVGQTLWNFTPQRREKIPLADLDVPATVKANDDRGVSFIVPPPHEGQ